ncbi:MAG: redox-sensing transcriptional repressor Rex [Candidatus Marinimicrobia bacterium]|nr:redox-sensing transcriptional repressor Rex [Candidatus Neomarinimicrobiota bacterium]
MEAKTPKISETVIRRLTDYLRCLRHAQIQGKTYLKSTELSQDCGHNPSIIRKDLAQFGAYGLKGTGYNTKELIDNLNKILGLTKPREVVLIGAGNLGTAMIKYPGFRSVNFKFTAAFDNDEQKIGHFIDETPILDLKDLNSFIQKHLIEIVILTVPASQTLGIIEHLDNHYVKGVLNFTSEILPSRKNDMFIHNIDLAKELEVISFCMKNCLS